jgi:hypothetical protein
LEQQSVDEQHTQVRVDRRGSVGAVDGQREAAQPWRTGLVAGSDETEKNPIKTCSTEVVNVRNPKPGL